MARSSSWSRIPGFHPGDQGFESPTRYQMKKKNLYILIGTLIIVIAVGYFINKKNYSSSHTASSPEISPSATLISPSPTLTSESPPPTSQNLPNSYLFKNFPFQPQAPFGIWDQLHDEACEEAAVTLVQYWHEGKSLSAETMDSEILKMVDWEIKNWGSHKDLMVKETAQMAKGFYNLSLTPDYDITIDDIKKEIAQNHPVIVPTAGRLLGNPYFRQPGPIYHMLVVIGYSGNNIIVQDIGTKRGEHYQYNQAILMNAIHDWNGSPDSIEQGRKAMLVLF